MTQVTLICVGSLKESYWREAVSEYEKRLGGFCRFEVIELKEERITDENDPVRVARALDAEGEKILARLPEGAFSVALCVEGKLMDSPALSAVIARASDERGKIALIIGSSHGLSPKVKAAVDLRLSLSPLTFPHQLSRVLIGEVLYRSFAIQAGKNYHK